MAHTDPDAPPKWVRWLWEVDASEAAEEREGGKGLDIGKIVRAGVALADDEGLEGVSVRKLAQRLDVSTMAAYRHISSRDEVIAAMVDVAFGPPPVLSDLSEDWSGGLRRWALAVYARYDAHPWLLDAPVHGMPTGPHRLRWMEVVLRVLAVGVLAAWTVLGFAGASFVVQHSFRKETIGSLARMQSTIRSQSGL